eukprot:10581838-Alexandrium_andersonii.AAC.1
MMLPRAPPRPRQLAGARKELHEQFMGLGLWGRQTGAWARAANKDTRLNASRYLGRAWGDFQSFGGPKRRNAKE